MDLPKGAELGNFVIDAKLAGGGDSETYLAHQPALGRTILVERLRGKVGHGNRVWSELAPELQLAARLVHPNVVQLFDCFAHRGDAYIVSEYVDGPTLAEVIEAGTPIPTKIGLQIALEVTRGLLEIHSRGIVHGSLRPDRIQLSRFGDTKLAGLRQAHDAGSSDVPDDLGDGPLVSPELRENSSWTPRSDIFSLGITISQLLSGKIPGPEGTRFPGISIRLAQVLRATLVADPTLRPKTYELRDALARELGQATALDCRVSIAAWLWEAESKDSGVSDAAPSPDPAILEQLSAPRRFQGRRNLVAAGVAAVAVAAVLAGTLWVSPGRDTASPDASNPALNTAAAAPPAPGRVAFVAHPWAEIQVDERPPFLTPAAIPLELAPGEHTIVFRHPTLGTREQTVEVRSGESQTLVEFMGPRP